MRTSVILGHPGRESFNHAIAQAVVGTLRENGYQVDFHDLYRERFDPILPYEEIPKGAPVDPAVQRYCDQIAAADGIVVIHPNWWGQPPALLKGWIDRVLRPGVAYQFLEGDGGEGVPVGLLQARAALVFNTSNTPMERELTVFGDPLELLWKDCIFGLCGVTTFHRKMYGVVVTSTAEQRRAWLAEVRQIVRDYFPRAGRG